MLGACGVFKKLNCYQKTSFAEYTLVKKANNSCGFMSLMRSDSIQIGNLLVTRLDDGSSRTRDH